MKAWILDQPGQPLALREVAEPTVRTGTVSVRMEAVPLLSYTRAYVEGRLPYAYPPGPFSPGTNGIGHVIAVGEGVHHFRPGQRVAVNPYWVANEVVAEPAQALLGLTAISADSGQVMTEFPHGTLREMVHLPASTLVPLHDLEQYSAAQLAALAKFVIPFGGLRRGRLAAGETVVINGAAGYFGSAAALAALALGAAKVIAIGRRAEPLQRLAALGQGRIETVVLSGDVDADAASIRQAAEGGADLAFDMVGQASDPHSTLAALKSLRRYGRLVLMGSMQTPLPIPYGDMLINNWELIGHFMYTPADYLAMLSLIKARLLSLDTIEIKTYPFADLESAIDEAGHMSGLQSTVVCFPEVS